MTESTLLNLPLADGTRPGRARSAALGLRLGCGVVSVLLTIACGGGDDGSNAASGASAMTPEELCAERCRLEVEANCAKTPPNYLSSCTAICLSKYAKYPSCEPALRPYDVCTVERVSYGCESDVVSPTPSGACAAEGAGCLACTGDLFGCL